MADNDDSEEPAPPPVIRFVPERRLLPGEDFGLESGLVHPADLFWRGKEGRYDYVRTVPGQDFHSIAMRFIDGVYPLSAVKQFIENHQNPSYFFITSSTQWTHLLDAVHLPFELAYRPHGAAISKEDAVSRSTALINCYFDDIIFKLPPSFARDALIARNVFEGTIFLYAAQSRSGDLVRLLLEKYDDAVSRGIITAEDYADLLTAPSVYYYTPLRDAIRQGDPEVLTLILDKYKALHQQGALDDADYARMLLTPDYLNRTPLFEALQIRNLQVAQHVMKFYADARADGSLAAASYSPMLTRRHKEDETSIVTLATQFNDAAFLRTVQEHYKAEYAARNLSKMAMNLALMSSGDRDHIPLMFRVASKRNPETLRAMFEFFDWALAEHIIPAGAYGAQLAGHNERSVLSESLASSNMEMLALACAQYRQKVKELSLPLSHTVRVSNDFNKDSLTSAFRWSKEKGGAAPFEEILALWDVAVPGMLRSRLMAPEASGYSMLQEAAKAANPDLLRVVSAAIRTYAPDTYKQMISGITPDTNENILHLCTKCEDNGAQLTDVVREECDVAFGEGEGRELFNRLDHMRNKEGNTPAWVRGRSTRVSKEQTVQGSHRDALLARGKQRVLPPKPPLPLPKRGAGKGKGGDRRR